VRSIASVKEKKKRPISNHNAIKCVIVVIILMMVLVSPTYLTDKRAVSLASTALRGEGQPFPAFSILILGFPKNSRRLKNGIEAILHNRTKRAGIGNFRDEI